MKGIELSIESMDIDWCIYDTMKDDRVKQKDDRDN